MDAEVLSSSAAPASAAHGRLNSSLTNSIMEFILHDDNIDIDILRKCLHHQVCNVVDSSR